MEDTIYIAEIGDKSVGFITIRIDGVGNIGAYVRMVAVAEQWRRKGIGHQLIDFVSQIAIQHIPNLFLICSVDNEEAQRFYEKIGFLRVGILPDLVINGHDELLYRKSFGVLY